MSAHLFHGECIAAMALLPDACVDAVVTDPPYHLTSIVKRFGKPGAAPAQFGSDGAFARASTGFMGKTWDGGDIAMRPEVWAQALRVLKPGGHALVFGGTRTHHRVWCALEDAGFEIRDTVMWVYGSGFPKSHDAGDGWGTALKPAFEPIALVRKPLIGTVAANVAAHGTGAINIDGCRVATPEVRPKDSTQRPHDEFGTFCESGGRARSTGSGANHAEGRWPANIIHDGSDEVLAAFPSTSSGTGAVKRASSADERGNTGAAFGKESRPAGTPMISYGDEGSAARFFYCAKASKSDREEGNKHPTVKPTALMQYLCRLITPPGGTVLDPFTGSGSTGKAALLEGFNFIGIEREAEYIAIAEKRIPGAKVRRPREAA